MKKQKPIIAAIIGGCIFILVGLAVYATYFSAVKYHDNDTDLTADTTTDDEADALPATPVVVTPQEVQNTAHDSSALGEYNVLIADRGNNRLIEVTPDKRIIWEYHFSLPRPGLGADDAFFTDNGQYIIANLEEYHQIEIIDYATKQVVWTYGHPGLPGHNDGYLNTPDDAYKLPNGDIIVADIKNCRILEIAPDHHLVRQYGKTRVCSTKPGYLNKPNGDTPLKNGHILISNIASRNLIELDQTWQPVFTMPLPVRYPSDPQQTQAGNILISDYSNPGKIVEVSRQGDIIWQFDGQPGDVPLNKPSLAIELPNGNIMSNDDLNQRVIIINKQTKKIVWQYGVTKKPGNGNGQLNIPDGVDIIKADDTNNYTAPAPIAPMPPLHTIGQITRHAQNFVNQPVRVQGYLLHAYNGYDIFSDEPAGTIGFYDLPVTGTGLDAVHPGIKYELTGTLLPSGLTASNRNPNHFELTSPPVAITAP